jgi:hypothetical protein
VNRRRFLVTTAGVTTVAFGMPWSQTAGAATDDELAFANFGISGEFLLKQFYSKAIEAKAFGRTQANVLKVGRSAASQHAKAFGDLLTDTGDVAAVEEDFEFVWPKNAFSSPSAIVATGLAVLRPLLGSYQTAIASGSEAEYRVLYASLAASLGQQIGALGRLSARSVTEPFPIALDLETASSQLEAYLG